MATLAQRKKLGYQAMDEIRAIAARTKQPEKYNATKHKAKSVKAAINFVISEGGEVSWNEIFRMIHHKFDFVFNCQDPRTAIMVAAVKTKKIKETKKGSKIFKAV